MKRIDFDTYREYPSAWVGATYQSGWKWADGDSLSWAPWSATANTADTAKSAAYYDVNQRGMVNSVGNVRKRFVCELEALGV